MKMGVPSSDDQKDNPLSPKIYQAPSSDMENMESPRKKKMFSSSSFFEEPNSIYPTIEEQVELCRKIAESLSDDCNQKSKGANMFFKRVKKAEKWIVAESNAMNDGDSQDYSKDPLKMPYVRPSKGLPKLKLILDPRQIVDMKRLIEEGVDIVEHNAVSPDICHDIVKDLNSPTGKGAQLFAKRKKKSVEWIVDEDKVKHLLEERYHMSCSSPDHSKAPLMHPRVKALSDVNSQVVKDSIIRAAEAKVMTYPNAIPHVPIISSLDRTISQSEQQKNTKLQTPLQSFAFNKFSLRSSDIHNYSIPKGWTGTRTSSPLSKSRSSPTVPNLSPKTSTTSVPDPYNLELSPWKTINFNNFNASPKAWSSDVKTQFRPASIRPVRPPSVLMQ